MTSESTTQRETTTRRTTNGGGTPESQDNMVQTAVREVRGAIEGVSHSVPEVARVSRSAVDEMFRAIETGSDERVTAGVSLSLGLALGMLLGGAPRLLILIALAPVVAAGLVLADRRATKGTSRASAS